MPLMSLDGRTYRVCDDKDLWDLVKSPPLFYRDRGGYESRWFKRLGTTLEKVKAMLIEAANATDQHVPLS